MARNNSETQQAERIIVRVDSEFKDLIPGFLDDWQAEIGSMRQALERNDYKTIRKLGHDMKGTGGACGFDAVTDMGGSLEEAAKGMEPDVIQNPLPSLSSFHERVEVVYK